MIARLNITTPEGVLIGQIDLDADDLAHPHDLGRRILEMFPQTATLCLECGEQPARGMSYGLCTDCLKREDPS